MKLKELLKEPYFLVHDLIFQKYNSYLSKNVELKNRYNNEKCFVLLNGEPLSYLNLKHLRYIHCFDFKWIVQDCFPCWDFITGNFLLLGEQV